MKSIASSFRCAKQRRDTWPETERWARRFIAAPARTAEQARHQAIVADLLAQVEVPR